MGRSKELFNKIREVEDYPPFDHEANFHKKAKHNWLSNEEFGALESKTLIEITQVLIDKKLSEGYLEMVMELVDKKEPKYINDITYIQLASKTTLENMQRIYKKYDDIDYVIQHNCKRQLEFYIGEKKRKIRENENI